MLMSFHKGYSRCGRCWTVYDPDKGKCHACFPPEKKPYPEGELEEIEKEWEAHKGKCPAGFPPEKSPHSPQERLDAKTRGADTAFHAEGGKPMVDQVPPAALLEIAKVFTYGVDKYGHFNWQEFADEWTWNQLYASCLRHLLAWQDGEDIDPESNLPHLAHAGCNIMMLLTLIVKGKGKDDRGPLAGNDREDDVVGDRPEPAFQGETTERRDA